MPAEIIQALESKYKEFLFNLPDHLVSEDNTAVRRMLDEMDAEVNELLRFLEEEDVF